MVEHLHNFAVENEMMKKVRVVFLVSILIISSGLTAQSGMLTLHGIVENESSSIGFVDIEVYKDNELLEASMTQRNGSFKLDLELGSIYSVDFSKSGYVHKSVGVISKADSTIEGRYFFQLDIELFRIDQEVIDATMLPPVAKLYIKDEEMGFRFDKKYVKWMSDEYKELEE